MLVGLLHSAWTVFIAIYAFVLPSKYDFVYMIYVLLLVISWLLFKDECVVTYIYRKMMDPSYTLGESAMSLDDASDIFGKSVVEVVIAGLMVVMTASLVVVSLRSGFVPPPVWIAFVLGFVIYLLTLRNFVPKSDVFRGAFLTVTVVYLFWMVYTRQQQQQQRRYSLATNVLSARISKWIF